MACCATGVSVQDTSRGDATDSPGLSYGSTLGSTVAAMFPDRIDRLVIDSVQNVHEYYNGYA